MGNSNFHAKVPFKICVFFSTLSMCSDYINMLSNKLWLHCPILKIKDCLPP